MKVDYEPNNTEQQADFDEEASLDSGNRKLGMIAGAVVLMIGAAIAFVPAENRERIANGQMPSFELMGASVVGTREAEKPAEAPKAETEEEADKAVASKTPLKPVVRPKTAAVAAQPGAPATEVAAPAVEAEPVAAPEPAAPVVEEAPRTVTLAGRVLDENGRPLAGATVYVKATRKVVSTDQNGKYAVEVPAGDNTLVYGYGGYEDQEMRSRSDQAMNVTLVPSEKSTRRRR
ncbi:carboxypeptidase-like regulatory domain-containing protein [Hymenobacter latericus]|uniref:carboxypeptidase-like regulatory domain-containing protein n=1 Tax=Hymenobacter sp. YIM 151858-1 TaxID=2987688 RepID=UPI002227F18C|nr:carboxypeptidase-like regulatory domain-containing protein [Hymenobacter sp. YIM 151858-1]UYZ60481.1 carboxypeptidase-like regulatory domain-containing protein [Hymenobacter sp. YIM 151858-1]